MFSCEKKSINECSFEHFNTMAGIKKPGLSESLNNYWLENLSEKGKGVIMADFGNYDNTSTFIIYSVLSEDIKKSPPNHDTMLRKVPVLFYTGLERHILFDSVYLSNLEKDVSPFLYEFVVDDENNILQLPPNYNPVVWKIEFEGDSLIKEVRLN